jgi:hypothetical protein
MFNASSGVPAAGWPPNRSWLPYALQSTNRFWQPCKMLKPGADLQSGRNGEMGQQRRARVAANGKVDAIAIPAD